MRDLFGGGPIHGLLHVIGREKATHDCVEVTPGGKNIVRSHLTGDTISRYQRTLLLSD